MDIEKQMYLLAAELKPLYKAGLTPKSPEVVGIVQRYANMFKSLPKQDSVVSEMERVIDEVAGL